MKTKVNSFLTGTRKVLWAIFLLSLPITNFRYFPGSLGGTKVQVRPLLILPMVGLLVLLLPGLWKRKLPRFYQPLLVFFLLALISSLLPYMNGTISQLAEVSLTSRFIRTMATLLLGIAVYITVSLIPESREDLDFTLKWLYAGLIMAIFWGSLQMIYVLELIPGFYVRFTQLQTHISANVGTPDRIMGMTLEPSWFADQITALWLPWVLPAAVQNRTVYKRRWGWITIEKILLIWMLVNLVFTLSRAGLVVGLVVVAAGIVFFRLHPESDSSSQKSAGWLGKISAIYQKIPRFVRIAVLSALGLLIAGFIFYRLGMSNPYIKRMWLYWTKFSSRVDTSGPRSLGGFFRYIGFGPRFVYWETAIRIFLENPFFGVGLGNYTFHFQDLMPPVQIGYMPEILKRFVPHTARVITAKNYLFRLLAETGLLGTGAYLAFVISLAMGAWQLWKSPDRDLKFWGAGGLLSVGAFLVDSFSFDSLAIPNPWVVFGLLTAAYSIFTSQKTNQEK